MSSASWALQAAIFATLSADNGIKSVLGNPPRIFDEVPRKAAMPYLVIADGRQSDWSTATDAGAEHALIMHVWSRARGHKEAKAIADAVRMALQNANLTLIGHTLINLRHQSSDFLRETDGETYHAVLRFRAVTEET